MEGCSSWQSSGLLCLEYCRGDQYSGLFIVAEEWISLPRKLLSYQIWWAVHSGRAVDCSAYKVAELPDMVGCLSQQRSGLFCLEHYTAARYGGCSSWQSSESV